MKQGILARSAIVAAAIIALAGCDSFRSSLGLDRHVPDETQVVARPPLTLPPDYSLRPPGTPTAASGDHESGQSLGQTPGTQGEQSLERSAGAGGASAAPKEEPGFFGRIANFFGLGDDDTQGAPAQAPAAEAAPQAPPSSATPTQSINGTPVPDANNGAPGATAK